MNILFVAQELPYPLNDGGRIRTYSLIKHLAQEHAVTLVAFETDQTDPGARGPLQELCEAIHILPLPDVDRPSLAERLRDLVRRCPTAMRDYQSQEMSNCLEGLIRHGSFDVLHVDQIYLAPYARRVTGVPRVMNHNDVEARLQRRLLLRDYSWSNLYWYLRWLEHWQWRSFETNCLKWFEAHFAVSEGDAAYFRRHAGDVPVTVVPNGVDIQYFQPEPRVDAGPVMMYVGSMDYQANIDAVLWFCEHVLPLVSAAIPEVCFQVVGRDPPAQIRQLGDSPAIDVTGTVPDVRPYYRQARVLVVPLRIGGGTRLKILEAMAMGVPIVSTSVGCEGLDLVAGRDLYVADDPQELADKAIRLLRDRETRQQMVRSGREIVELKYAWDAVGGELLRTYQIAAERKRGNSTRGAEQ